MTEFVATELIQKLGLHRHPEGGWYREVYRSTDTIAAAALPERFAGERSICTSIYFMLEQGDFSALHRIKSDELWHFYAGAPLTVHVLAADGTYQAVRLGSDLAAGDSFQAVVAAGCWFGAELSGGLGFALVGCTVAPGFDFADFEIGCREVLLQLFPEQAALVNRLTNA